MHVKYNDLPLGKTANRNNLLEGRKSPCSSDDEDDGVLASDKQGADNIVDDVIAV